MISRLRRWWATRSRPVDQWEWYPGIHLVHEVSAPPDELPPSAAIKAPKDHFTE